MSLKVQLSQLTVHHPSESPLYEGDLVQQRNPTCWVDTYQGGLSCCHHQNLLLDKDQTPPEDILSYQMKFRFYYQPYPPPSEKSPAAHENLLRMYYQTEANAGEYDIPKCEPGVSPEHCVHEITAHFKVSDMLRVRPEQLLVKLPTLRVIPLGL